MDSKEQRLTLLCDNFVMLNKVWCGLYQCECGNIKVVSRYNVPRNTNSCGCLKKEQMRIKATRHGHRGAGHTIKTASKTYITWVNMRQRCYNTHRPDYRYYGGKGIEVCFKWRESFINFLEDMGEKPSNDHTIDRIDTKGNYTKDNCQWVTKSQNSLKMNQERRSTL